MNLAHWLERSAAVSGDRTAIAHGDQAALTYGQLADGAARGACWLRTQGLQPGDRVGLYLAASPDYFRLLWSIWWAGLVAVPLDAALSGREAGLLLSDCAATLCFVDHAHGDALSGFLPGACRVIAAHEFLDDPALTQACAGRPGRARAGRRRVAAPSGHVPVAADGARYPVAVRSDEDDAWIFYTSGTTGKPKGVRLSTHNLACAALAWLVEVQPVAAGDAYLNVGSLARASGIHHLAWVLRAGVSVLPASGGFDADELAALAGHWRNASLYALPHHAVRLAEYGQRHGGVIDGLATLAVGGAQMSRAQLIEVRDAIGPHLVQIYGQGECAMTISVLTRTVIEERGHPRWAERMASVGRAQPLVEIGIQGADGALLPPRRSGEICVRGATVMKGYWKRTLATVGTLRHGWLHTGDIGMLDDDGFLTLLELRRLPRPDPAPSAGVQQALV